MNLFEVYKLWDIEPVRGLGTTLWDKDGNVYTDLYGGHAVISVGHSHPHYVGMLTEQLGKLGFYSNAVQNSLQKDLAYRLGKVCGYDDYALFLCNSGAEANENALKVAQYLKGHEKVAWVEYPGLPDSKYYDLAQKQFRDGNTCGVLTFGIKGGREESIKFMDNLKLVCIVTHVADTRSCVLHPASHTHRQLSDEQLIEAGVRPDLIRFSTGIEDAADIIADIEQALEAI